MFTAVEVFISRDIYMSGVNTLKTSDFEMCTLTNSEDPGEMLHNASFYMSLHFLLSRGNTIFI